MTEISKRKKVTDPKKVREQGIGPFEYDEAVECINKFALALTNLGLSSRFTVAPAPHRIVGSGRHAMRDEGHERKLYQVILVDRRPDEPYPRGLTALQITAAEAKGYTKPKVKQYEAFGETKNLNQWAKAVGVSWPTLKSRIDAGMTMEEALTQIALRKAAS